MFLGFFLVRDQEECKGEICSSSTLINWKKITCKIFLAGQLSIGSAINNIAGSVKIK
jgi:hypothetical protein